jgi:hypothetical protein
MKFKFIVDRATWYRGHGADKSYLLRDDGHRCCIGFVAKQCGVADDDMSLIRDVITLPINTHTKFPLWMRGLGISKAYNTNDNQQLTDTEREAQLKTLFTENGDEIEFIN